MIRLNPRKLASRVALLAAGSVIGLSAQASAVPVARTVPAATITQTFTATVSGTSVTTPTNGTLYLYDDPLALHHSRNVEYYDHDGYSKTAVLTSSTRPLGVVLKAEFIDNNCDTYTAGGSVNPPHGDGSNCHPVLWAVAQPSFSKANGDLVGRYCRVAAPGDPSPSDCTADSIHRSEIASGSGQYLTVGDKDHGGLVKVSYYANVAGVDYEVTAILPAIVGAVDYDGTVRTIQPLVTEIVLLPQGATAPHAVLVLQ